MPQLARIPGLRRLPQVLGPVRDDVVLFESWRGQFSDNPRAISEELRRRGSELRHVWVLDPALAGSVPEWVEPVAPGSHAYLSMLGRARYLVANSTVPGYHRKRRGTTFMQTWHGTPLKKIGFHTKWRKTRAGRQAEATLKRNVPNWDIVLSPNSFSTGIFREAFGVGDEILETGYPRNDLLLAPEAGEIRERTRAALGIADGQQAVLYAPTFRDDANFPFERDLQRLARDLTDHVVLARLHKMDVARRGLGEDAGYRDVSRYQDNRELFLAADVLVTDYSSVMFDFAVTRKPMVFFTPDLAVYRDELRGFYFDFEAEAPGPLVPDVDALVATVRDVDAIAGPHADAYARFVERFCHLEDGRASARAVDALLA